MNYHTCWNKDRRGRGMVIAEEVCVRKYACDWLRDGECKFVPKSERDAKKYQKKVAKKKR